MITLEKNGSGTLLAKDVTDFLAQLHDSGAPHDTPIQAITKDSQLDGPYWRLKASWNFSAPDES